MFRAIANAGIIVCLLSAPSFAADATKAEPHVVNYLGIGLNVSDLQKSYKFYQLLGFKPAHRNPEPLSAKQMRLTQTGSPADSMILMTEVEAGKLAGGKEGFGKIAFDVSDAVGMAKKISDAGYTVSKVNHNEKADLYIFTLHDPDGYLIECIQRPAPAK